MYFFRTLLPPAIAEGAAIMMADSINVAVANVSGDVLEHVPGAKERVLKTLK